MLEIKDGACAYCVANPKAPDELIQNKLDYCCGRYPQSCKPIQPGAPCYVPNDLRTTASYVFSDLFAGGEICDNYGAGIMTLNDPSKHVSYLELYSSKLKL